MKTLQKLDLTTLFLFTLIFLGLALVTSALIPISNQVWDDISIPLSIISIISGIVSILLSSTLYSKGKSGSKILALAFIIILLIFEYVGLKEFISAFY